MRSQTRWVAFHERSHLRQPVTAKTLMLGGDLLACVLGGVYTDVEKTTIEIRRSTIVQETRNAFQNARQGRFIKAVEDRSGRTVLSTGVHLNPPRRPRHRNRPVPSHPRSEPRSNA